MSEKTYFTIAEVSKKAQVPEYTIRYWEQKFRLLRPLRLASGHRRYVRADIDTLLEIKDLVFVKGYSLDGARKELAAKKRRSKAVKATAATASAKHNLLEDIRTELRQIIKEL